MTGGQNVSAINAYIKLYPPRQTKEPTPDAGVDPLFCRLTVEERETFVLTGTLPEWFLKALAPASSEGAEERKNGGEPESTSVQ